MPTAKNGLHILYLHSKKYIAIKKIFNASLLEKFPIISWEISQDTRLTFLLNEN